MYTSHTRFQELARISDNVLATRAPIGNVPASPTSSPAGNTAVDNRLGARTATSSPVSSRAVDNRLGARVVEEETAVVARRAESLVARQGAEKAVRSAAIRSAARVAGRAALTFARVLLTVISRVIAILDAVGLILFAAEIVSMIWDAFRDRAMNEAIEKAMKTHLTGDISAALEKHRDEIARYYAREWLKNRGSDPTFLYLSPRLTVDGFYGEKGFDFDVKLIVKSIAEDLVSVDFVEPRRDESERGPLYYHFEIRWSAQQPIYTPFDIYLSFTDFFAEHVVDSWAAHYQSGKKLASEVVNQFHLVVRTLAHISATLKYEPWFGWDPEDQRFSPHKFAVGRMEALKELSAIIDNKLIPAVSALESQRLINTGTVRWDAFWSPMRQELDPRWGESLLPSMRRIAFDMGTFGARHLEYQRLDHSQYRTRARATPIKLQEDLDFYEYLKPVSQYLPKKLAPVDPFANQLVIEQPFTVDGVTFLAPDE